MLGDDAAVVQRVLRRDGGRQLRGDEHPVRAARPSSAVAGEVGLTRRRSFATSIARAQTALYEARAKRVWPGRDDKILAAWNGLMVRAFAEAARAFGDADVRARWRCDARDVPVRRDSCATDACCARTKTAGARIAGYLEDHAALGARARSRSTS